MGFWFFLGEVRIDLCLYSGFICKKGWRWRVKGGCMLIGSVRSKRCGFCGGLFEDIL